MRRGATVAERGPVRVVDDEPVPRQMVRWALEEEGCGVVEAAAGAGARGAPRPRPPRLVLLDMGMAGVNGRARGGLPAAARALPSCW
jgi:CheY-like chemotaxis protein